MDGSWNDSSIIATFLNTCCKTIKFDVENVSQLIAKVEPLVSSLEQKKASASFSLDSTIFTLIILAILSARFKARRTEWSLIEKKAKKYLA